MAGVKWLSRSTVMHERFRKKSDSKHYIWQSMWDEWRRVSHCPTNWWTFLFRLSSTGSSLCLSVYQSKTFYWLPIWVNVCIGRLPYTPSRWLLNMFYAIRQIGDHYRLAYPQMGYLSILNRKLCSIHQIGVRSKLFAPSQNQRILNTSAISPDERSRTNYCAKKLTCCSHFGEPVGSKKK